MVSLWCVVYFFYEWSGSPQYIAWMSADAWLFTDTIELQLLFLTWFCLQRLNGLTLLRPLNWLPSTDFRMRCCFKKNSERTSLQNTNIRFITRCPHLTSRQKVFLSLSVFGNGHVIVSDKLIRVHSYCERTPIDPYILVYQKLTVEWVNTHCIAQYFVSLKSSGSVRVTFKLLELRTCFNAPSPFVLSSNSPSTLGVGVFCTVSAHAICIWPASLRNALTELEDERLSVHSSCQSWLCHFCLL